MNSLCYSIVHPVYCSPYIRKSLFPHKGKWHRLREMLLCTAQQEYSEMFHFCLWGNTFCSSQATHPLTRVTHKWIFKHHTWATEKYLTMCWHSHCSILLLCQCSNTQLSWCVDTAPKLDASLPFLLSCAYSITYPPQKTAGGSFLLAPGIEKMHLRESWESRKSNSCLVLSKDFDSKLQQVFLRVTCYIAF